MLWFRWFVVLWLLVLATSHFASVAMALQYDSVAAFYLMRSGAVRPGDMRDLDVPLASIAVYLARDVAWGIGLLILAVAVWRWNRWGWWAVAALFSWFLFRGVWGFVRFVMLLEILSDPAWDWHWFIWYRGVYLLLEALMLVWLMLPKVRARFDGMVPAKATS